MPATTTTRTCPFPGHEGPRELPFDAEHFYTRPNGQTDYWCRECVRRYNRENRTGTNRRARRAAVRNGRRFGVEIEFMGDAYALEAAMTRLGMRVEYMRYTHRVMRGWKIVTDGSLRDGGYELVSPPLRGAAGREQVQLACQALREIGASVDNSCGLHIHHEVTDLNGAQMKALAHGWAASQQATNQLVAASRRGGQWCRELNSMDLDRIDRIADNANADGIRPHLSYLDRYRSLNLAGYPRYGTVEVRQHQGTLNAKKILAWLDFGQAMVERGRDVAAHTDHHAAETLLAQLTSYGLSGEQVAYLTQRAERFATTRSRAYARGW